MTKKKNDILENYRQLFDILPDNYKPRFYLLFALILTNTLVDVFALGSVVPLVSILLDKSLVQSNQTLLKLYNGFGFTSVEYFLVFLAILVFVVFLVKNLFALFVIKFQTKFAYSLSSEISQKQFILFNQKGLSFLKSKNSTELVNSAFNLPMHFANNITLSSINFLSEATVILIILVGLTIYQPILILLVGLVIGPLFIIAYKSANKKIRKFEIRINEVSPFAARKLFQSIFGYMDIKLSNRDVYFFNEYRSVLAELVQLQEKKYLFTQLPNKILETSIFLCLSLLIVFSSLFPEYSGTSVVTIISIFALASYRLMPSMNRIMIALMGIKGFSFIFDHIRESRTIDFNQFMSDHQVSESGLKFEHTIAIKGIEFWYKKDTPVLRDINLEICKGDVLGIVGKSGSGKTTLMNILLGFLLQSKGSIEVDGIPLSQANKFSWRALIGYVPQDGYIVDGTVAENIAFGHAKETWSIQKVNTVLKQVDLFDLVDKMPEKIHSEVGENGANLSGGQKQRLIIARALYNDVKILVLDEATSSLDNQTELLFSETIKELAMNSGITCIMIAHRYSTLVNCNKIIELDKGVIHKNYKSYHELINSK
ncbi:MAG: ABC transporter ATP-binding protein [Flavobacteriales bacterium]|nr:ABC transporter ATP-binding protein [Flavobacteriales bacterium]